MKRLFAKVFVVLALCLGLTQTTQAQGSWPVSFADLYAPDGVVPTKLIVYTILTEPGDIVVSPTANSSIENVMTDGSPCIDGRAGAKLCQSWTGAFKVVVRVLAPQAGCGMVTFNLGYEGLPQYDTYIRTPYKALPACTTYIPQVQA